MVCSLLWLVLCLCVLVQLCVVCEMVCVMLHGVLCVVCFVFGCFVFIMLNLRLCALGIHCVML